MNKYSEKYPNVFITQGLVDLSKHDPIIENVMKKESRLQILAEIDDDINQFDNSNFDPMYKEEYSDEALEIDDAFDLPDQETIPQNIQPMETQQPFNRAQNSWQQDLLKWFQE